MSEAGDSVSTPTFAPTRGWPQEKNPTRMGNVERASRRAPVSLVMSPRWRDTTQIGCVLEGLQAEGPPSRSAEGPHWGGAL